MSFNINGGLFKLDFTDRHAILGVPVDADISEIRQRYLQIARRLHPDSGMAKSTADKQRANQLLSKLVNPAYEKFSKERNRVEYIVLLKEMSKRLAQEATSTELKYDLSKQLSQTNNIDHLYKTSLSKLAQKQYESLNETAEIIAQISELNLVYLMRQGGKVLQSVQMSQDSKSSSGREFQPSPAAQPAPPPTAEASAQAQQKSLAESYIRRAQILIEKNNLTQARIELQDALKLDHNNSLSHSLMGIVYLKQNQMTMAKVHINKALELNPQEELALKGKSYLAQMAPKTTAASKNTQSKGGGLFGGLFGGKKNK